MTRHSITRPSQEPVLRLLPTDFTVCGCGHLRVHHVDDVYGTGRCEHANCKCRVFTARVEDMPEEPPRRWR